VTRCRSGRASQEVFVDLSVVLKLIAALDSAGIDLIGEGAVSQSGGRGVRLKGLGAASRGKPMAKLQPVEG
jgi:hypothetical protein